MALWQRLSPFRSPENKADVDACENMAFNKTGGKLQGLKEKSAARHACLTSLQSTELAAEGGFAESPASTCPHRNPRWLSQTTGPPQRPPSGVILSSHTDFLEAQDMYSINLNYLEISDSLYRFVPAAELTILPFKKKQNSFCPGLKATVESGGPAEESQPLSLHLQQDIPAACRREWSPQREPGRRGGAGMPRDVILP